MFKIFSAGGWGRMDQPDHLIKVSSRGLRGADRQNFLKIASHEFLDLVDNLKLGSGDIPIHLNAMGATEGYGPNRNGDGFREGPLMQYHPTFCKFAKYYRHHQNTDPEISYGFPKYSMYNKPMRRVELLLLGNGNKEAADRNGGLIMKSGSIAKLERGESLDWSMACHVPLDVCSNCHHKAANRREYCTAENCINPETGRQGFGCRDGLTKVGSDGFIQYVDNPDPTFCDISEVGRGADRIAKGGIADYLQKAASAEYPTGGAELAELLHYQHPAFQLLGPTASRRMKQAQLELELLKRASAQETPVKEMHPAILPTGVPRFPHFKSAREAVPTLAAHGIMLPLGAFFTLETGRPISEEVLLKVSGHLPGIYSKMLQHYNLDNYNNPYSFTEETAVSQARRDWGLKLAADFSGFRKFANQRAYASILASAQMPKPINQTLKTASNDPAAYELAERYAMFKLAVLANVDQLSPEFSNLLRLAVCQNNFIA